MRSMPDFGAGVVAAEEEAAFVTIQTSTPVGENTVLGSAGTWHLGVQLPLPEPTPKIRPKFSNQNDSYSPLECFVLTRQGKAEKFVLTFEQGQLVESLLPTIPTEAIPKSKLE